MAMQDRGCQVVVHQGDVSQLSDVTGLFEHCHEAFGGIDGIFHIAGLAHLQYLNELTDDVMKQEFDSKRSGVLNLRHGIETILGCEKAKPKFVMLFSSLASILGGFAMTSYAAANRFMDAFVQLHPRSNGVDWIVVNWDDWAFDYSKEQTASYEKTQAQFSMTPEQGLNALEMILKQVRRGQIVVSTRPLQPRVEKSIGGCKSASRESVVIQSVDKAMPTNLRTQVLSVYNDVLGLNQSSGDDNFFELGGDSLMATQILLKLQHLGLTQKTTNEAISLRSIFDYPTVNALTDWLEE